MYTALLGPGFVYYMKMTEENPKFPATYSYITREGLPLLVFKIFWNAGLLLYMKHVFKHGSWISKSLIVMKFISGFLAMI